MPWLKIPHLPQREPGWCLPACVAMTAAYLQQPLLQEDVARWLHTRKSGTPARQIVRMAQRGFIVTYTDLGSLTDLESWLNRNIPPILFVLTGELSYWSINTQHAVVLGGLSGNEAHLFDPGFDTAPVSVPIDELSLAWSHFDYTYATLEVSPH